MRLSMWILNDWLEQYSPEPRIEEGLRTLQNVRLYSSLGKVSRNTVYLNEIEPGKIMCANGRDIIILKSNDIEEILNSILDAFEYYNEWAGQLDSMIHGHCTLDELLQFGHTVIHRTMLIGDSSYYLRNICAQEEIDFENETFQATLNNRIMPLPVLMKINQDKKFRASGRKTFLSAVSEMGVTSAMNNLFINKKHVGWLLTQSKDNTYTQGELDIQDAFADMVIGWLTDNSENIADLALRFRAQREPGMIDIQNSMLTYMLSLIWENTVTNPVHPALGMLQTYDREHSTSFSETLFVFLRNTCNYVDTAKELFIHRSTLLYRIQKIQSITQIDLEDFTTRVYLELSYLLEKNGTAFSE